MTQKDLDALASLEAAATPGPWHVRFMDDVHCMSAVAVSTKPDTGKHESMRAGGWPGEEIVAATLIQEPSYVIPSDDRWDENAALIANVRSALPELLRLARLGLMVDQEG